jgi:hypothetical protein
MKQLLDAAVVKRIEISLCGSKQVSEHVRELAVIERRIQELRAAERYAAEPPAAEGPES